MLKHSGIALLLATGLGLSAQGIVKNTPPELRLKGFEKIAAMRNESAHSELKWQWIGPTNVSGRMTSLAVATPKGKTYTIYAGSATGGVWKTTNEGTTWEALFDQGPTASIGALALAPSNQDILWIGTGEANIFRSSHAGCGIYKSVDAGKTWQHMGLADTNTIARIVIHPRNPDIVYVAASGHEWTDNAERGVYKTTDGGRTWQKQLFINDQTGAIDLVMDPEDSETLYAATWQRRREKWSDPRTFSDYRHSGIHKSTDGGRTWKQINQGIPAPQHRGRIALDVARSKPNVLYAFVDNYESYRAGTGTDAYGRPQEDTIKGFTVYRSDNKGESWRQVSDTDDRTSRICGTYGWVFGQIRVDPTDENRVYSMGVPLVVSTDGGKTWDNVPGLHSDHHDLWIDPTNPNYMVEGNDGGLYISYDRGKSWKFNVNIPVSQFFNVNVDNDSVMRVYGSMQDHGSYRGAIDPSRGRDRIIPVEFFRTVGWEAGNHAVDPTDPRVAYGAGFYGEISRWTYDAANQNAAETKVIVPKPKEGELPLRGQWMAPFILSTHNPQIIYHGFQYVHRSTDRGETWERISPDLTHNDIKTLGDIPYHTLFTLSESPLKFGLLYAGTDDGRLWISRDHGNNWKELSSKVIPGKWMSRVVASKYDLGTVYLTQNGKRDDDFTPYVWKSTDFGETWVRIDKDIPVGTVNVIIEDPKVKDVLYLGTDGGVFVSQDGGKSWKILGSDLPTTYVLDLVVHPVHGFLVAATHGRGMWVIDIDKIHGTERPRVEQPRRRGGQ
ncbi:MAG: hypothetical protein FWG12_00890 [Holophagaceae bacterium]|nr:hypothetical protein [Holophagaceae bacterium]